jgi:hypothetical protein
LKAFFKPENSSLAIILRVGIHQQKNSSLITNPLIKLMNLKADKWIKVML